MKARKIGYWVTTALMALGFAASGALDIARPPSAMAVFTHLGYPAYFALIIGVWKVLAAVAIVVPRFPRLKEWAYAGMVFDLTGAAASHTAVGDGARDILPPLVFLALVVTSWALRPDSRVLGHLGAPTKAAQPPAPAT